MKKFILNFKAAIRFIVSIIVSRESAFLYCVLGTIAQISHTYFLVNSISSLDGNWKILQAVMIAVFISSSLLYFTAIADNSGIEEDEIKMREYKKIIMAVNLFTVIEIIINIYYYTRHLIIDKIDAGQKYQIFDYIFAVLVSALIPITIKLYSSSIRAKDWISDIEHDKSALVSEDLVVNKDFELNQEQLNKIAEQINNNFDWDPIRKQWKFDIDSKFSDIVSTLNDNKLNESEIIEFANNILKNNIEKLDLPIVDLSENQKNMITELFNTQVEDLLKNVNIQISSSFEKNSELFLKQFSNKMALAMSEKLA